MGGCPRPKPQHRVGCALPGFGKDNRLEQNATLRGVALMVVAMGVLPLLDVCAKFLGQGGIPILQIVWARMFFGAVFILPFAWRAFGPRCLVPERLGFHAARAAFLVGSTGFFFGAISFMPIADSLAIFFVQPLLITALSPLLLKEKVGPRRVKTGPIGPQGSGAGHLPGEGQGEDRAKEHARPDNLQNGYAALAQEFGANIQ